MALHDGRARRIRQGDRRMNTPGEYLVISDMGPERLWLTLQEDGAMIEMIMALAVLS